MAAKRWLPSHRCGRSELHPAFSVIGPCAADEGFAVSEVETLNLQGEHFVDTHASTNEEARQQSAGIVPQCTQEQ